jgi:hypothetical protein
VRALRLAGFALAAAGFPCPALWDPAAPLRGDLYGPRERAMCAAAYAPPPAGAAAAA